MANNFKNKSLKHQIADEIRQYIFQGKLNPGDKITETKISKDLDVSRGPVREAIQLLVMEGLLVSITFKETRVSSVTTEEVTELLLPMRIHMESFALKKAYPLLDQAHFDQLEKNLEYMERAADYNDLPLFNELDIQFHEFIIKSSNMSNVMHLWQGIVNRIRLHFLYQNTLNFELEKFCEDHRYLLSTFKTGGLEASIQSLKDHIIKTNTPAAELLPDQENQ